MKRKRCRSHPEGGSPIPSTDDTPDGTEEPPPKRRRLVLHGPDETRRFGSLDDIYEGDFSELFILSEEDKHVMLPAAGMNDVFFEGAGLRKEKGLTGDVIFCCLNLVEREGSTNRGKFHTFASGNWCEEQLNYVLRQNENDIQPSVRTKRREVGPVRLFVQRWQGLASKCFRASPFGIVNAVGRNHELAQFFVSLETKCHIGRTGDSIRILKPGLSRDVRDAMIREMPEMQNIKASNYLWVPYGQCVKYVSAHWSDQKLMKLAREPGILEADIDLEKIKETARRVATTASSMNELPKDHHAFSSREKKALNEVRNLTNAIQAFLKREKVQYRQYRRQELSRTEEGKTLVREMFEVLEISTKACRHRTNSEKLKISYVFLDANVSLLMLDSLGKAGVIQRGAGARTIQKFLASAEGYVAWRFDVRMELRGIVSANVAEMMLELVNKRLKASRDALVESGDEFFTHLDSKNISYLFHHSGDAATRTKCHADRDYTNHAIAPLVPKKTSQKKEYQHFGTQNTFGGLPLALSTESDGKAEMMRMLPVLRTRLGELIEAFPNSRIIGTCDMKNVRSDLSAALESCEATTPRHEELMALLKKIASSCFVCLLDRRQFKPLHRKTYDQQLEDPTFKKSVEDGTNLRLLQEVLELCKIPGIFVLDIDHGFGCNFKAFLKDMLNWNGNAEEVANVVQKYINQRISSKIRVKTTSEATGRGATKQIKVSTFTIGVVINLVWELTNLLLPVAEDDDSVDAEKRRGFRRDFRAAVEAREVTDDWFNTMGKRISSIGAIFSYCVKEHDNPMTELPKLKKFIRDFAESVRLTSKGVNDYAHAWICHLVTHVEYLWEEYRIQLVACSTQRVEHENCVLNRIFRSSFNGGAQSIGEIKVDVVSEDSGVVDGTRDLPMVRQIPLNLEAMMKRTTTIMAKLIPDELIDEANLKKGRKHFNELTSPFTRVAHYADGSRSTNALHRECFSYDSAVKMQGRCSSVGTNSRQLRMHGRHRHRRPERNELDEENESEESEWPKKSIDGAFFHSNPYSDIPDESCLALRGDQDGAGIREDGYLDWVLRKSHVKTYDARRGRNETKNAVLRSQEAKKRKARESLLGRYGSEESASKMKSALRKPKKAHGQIEEASLDEEGEAWLEREAEDCDY